MRKMVSTIDLGFAGSYAISHLQDGLFDLVLCHITVYQFEQVLHSSNDMDGDTNAANRAAS